MKKLLLSFGALGLALAVQAQLTVSTTPAPDPDAGQNHQEASQPDEPVNGTRPDRHSRKRHRTDGPDALVWVDATGKTVGRYARQNSLVIPYNGQLAFVQGLQTSDCIPGGRTCTAYPGGGARWNTRYSLFYTSSDCTGQAYGPFGHGATPYSGIPIVDEGTTYIYFFEAGAMSPVTLNSSFAGNQCSTSVQGLTQSMAPSVGVLPALDLGAEPFMVK